MHPVSLQRIMHSSLIFRLQCDLKSLQVVDFHPNRRLANKSAKTSMSSYDFAGGSLKLKGTSGGIKKKKKSKNDSKKLANAVIASGHDATKNDVVDETQTVKEKEPHIYRKKTEAELKFEEIQRKRQADRISKIASQSHKERVAEFNKYLENLSEHYDIPKVGPG
ncbi:uncharacterized protein SPPG_08689 [Spizellomyces punctatus DAOM BR117]|uniref:Protein FAM32A n=1 Tax=Spizellomyces punctatus (strain DAOM BR117) TaxID=645134 RepID=A0A0L0H4U7_SPIPD|nr:uncharacterized protein SPPG_08689 [Spizellomyces punctatus DAOM BR117]KNC95936.1 hypothetical protein SPPG_08689 [Spizellomyces punctatus DAOM BR117]|eukprot:XP_016603976.1 hypothetical protein SPPG_08689 [Spizellomyces punctatus DAOM BR117]